MALNSNDIGLAAFQKFIDVLRSGKVKSLTEYTRNFRAEPFVMIDSECVFEDVMYDVMQSLQSQYAGYYMLAMSTMTTIGNIQVAQHMNKLNPSRSSLDAAATSASMLGGIAFAAENDMLTRMRNLGGAPRDDEDGTKVDNLTTGVGKDSIKHIHELSNLSVGKIISCEVSDGNNTVSIPVSIRLIANSLPADSLVHILSGGQADKTWLERWHGFKSGRLSLADMLFCSDLVKAEVKAGIADKDGIRKAIQDRKKGNSWSAILSGSPSVGTYSNMAVLTETTAKELELAMAGKSLKDYRAREALFDESALMILAIIDRQWKRVTFYHQGITRPIECGFKDLKTSNKGTGPDVAEILNAYRLGNTPVL